MNMRSRYLSEVVDVAGTSPVPKAVSNILPKAQVLVDDRAPINVTQDRWSPVVIGGNKVLTRTLTFDSAVSLKWFLIELVEYESQSKHEGRTVIEGKKVSIEVYTKAVNDITSLDLEYADEVDMIYDDSKDVGAAPVTV